MKTILFAFLVLAVTFVSAKEYHVSKKGNNNNPGTADAPFLTIQAAANVAQAGDIITVHEGIYRERVDPINGGTGDDKRVMYRAAEGEKVVIKGSEVITNWKKLKKGVWKVEVADSFFQDYHSLKDSINGDWFHSYGRIHHTGQLFLNDECLNELVSLDTVFNSIDTKNEKSLGNGYAWYCESNDNITTIWANFHKINPNKELIEISVRSSCFYPSKQGIDYISIHGFEFSQAATQWAAPTAEQVGMIATHWNKGWIIENNIIHDSRCNGITLGKERSTGHNTWSADVGNINRDGNIHYIEVIFNALRHGWNKENVGSHIVRNNEIYNCGQTAICGSFGAAFSTIEENNIHDIYTNRQYGGHEMGGIKFHAAIDATIRKNKINNAYRGMWLDWMTQGVRVSQNLMYENSSEDLYLEVNHGPYLIDNNISLSRVSVTNQSSGAAYVHNLFVGQTINRAEASRFTPYHLPHSTEIAGLSTILVGDIRYYNNIFIGIGEGNGIGKGGINAFGTSALNDSLNLAWGLKGKRKIEVPCFVNNNAYYNGATATEKENNKLLAASFDPQFKYYEEDGAVYIEFNVPEEFTTFETDQINTEYLGKAKQTKAKFENTDGSPLIINKDYLDMRFSAKKVISGPLSNLKIGHNKIKVW